VKRTIYITLRESKSQYRISIDTPLLKFLEATIRRFNALNFNYYFEKKIFNYSINKKKSSVENHFIEILPTHIAPYTFINNEDLVEMQDIIEKMQESRYENIYDLLTKEELLAYRTTFSYYSNYLKFYSQITIVSNVVAELSVLISLYCDKCLILGNDFRTLLQSFVNNLAYWQEKLFINGGEELTFLDDSFQADLEQIKISLELYDNVLEEENSLEDIFQF
jgi:hypothetical protein